MLQLTSSNWSKESLVSRTRLTKIFSSILIALGSQIACLVSSFHQLHVRKVIYVPYTPFFSDRLSFTRNLYLPVIYHPYFRCVFFMSSSLLRTRRPFAFIFKTLIRLHVEFFLLVFSTSSFLSLFCSLATVAFHNKMPHHKRIYARQALLRHKSIPPPNVAPLLSGPHVVSSLLSCFGALLKPTVPFHSLLQPIKPSTT